MMIGTVVLVCFRTYVPKHLDGMMKYVGNSANPLKTGDRYTDMARKRAGTALQFSDSGRYKSLNSL